MDAHGSRMLSPDAAVFIPRQSSPRDDPPLQQIPSYMTSCYPFVQTEQERNKVHLSRTGRPPTRFAPPFQTPGFPRSGVGQNGSGMAGPPSYPPPFPAHPPMDSQWIAPPTPVLPYNYMMYLPPDMPCELPMNDQGKPVKSKKKSPRQGSQISPRQGSQMSPRQDSPRQSSQRSPRHGSQSSPRQESNTENMDDFNGKNETAGKKTKGEKGQDERKRGNSARSHQRGRNNSERSKNIDSSEGDVKGNHGNERDHQGERSGNLGDSWNSGHHKRNRTPVVIMKECSIQTEFSDKFANLTLAQFPSPLYCNSSAKLTGSSEEEVDSDSGYHSPLHRKNQVSSGTHPAVTVHTMIFSNSHRTGNANRPNKNNNHSDRRQVKSAEAKPTQQVFSYAFVAQKKSTIEATSETKPEEKEEAAEEKTDVKEKTEGNVENEGKKKRKRNRRRRRKKKEASGEETDEEPQVKEVELHFEDEEEFPDLANLPSCKSGEDGARLLPSYSSVLTQKSTNVPAPQKTSWGDVSQNCWMSVQKEKVSTPDVENEAGTLPKNPKRRRKKRELVQQAAEEELAEISLEQQMLRELNLKAKVTKQPGILKVNPQQSTKKTKQGISLDLSAMIDALEKKKPEVTKTPEVTKKKTETKDKDNQKAGLGHNLLDSTAPVKRGKEREVPKAKKPSSLKKVILKEREEKKKMRLLDDSDADSNGVSLGIGVVSGNESDLSQDAYSNRGSVNEYVCIGTPASNDLSPISQTSPISMSPLSPGVSPQSSEVNSPIAGTIGKEVRMKIHSRRFREYCNQVLNKDIDNCCTRLLQDLVRFQDRMYHKDPVKAKTKRRLVLGLREVTKHLKLKKVKCVIISPNLEKIQSKGGLDDALNNILNLCNEQNVPFVFALGRRALGRACAKLVPVSVVGIFNYEGSDENFRSLMDLTEQARQSYKEMVGVIEKEIREYPTLGAAAAVPHIYAHMGHSRTPSGASVLSFTSSILSEPISENYPHSEPETDSKGYEIIRDGSRKPTSFNPSITEVYKTQMKFIYPHCNYPVNVDIDDGNEADTEEYIRKTRSLESRLHGNDDDGSEVSDNTSHQGSLPHIDSIHSSTYELNTEIMSQNSGKTVDNCDAISTHSSRTLGDGSSTILADPGDRSKHDTPKSTESPSNTLQRGKVVDSERIQNWVDQTKSRLEDLQYLQENSENTSESDENSSAEDTVDELNLSSGFDKSQLRDIKCSDVVCETICDINSDIPLGQGQTGECHNNTLDQDTSYDSCDTCKIKDSGNSVKLDSSVNDQTEKVTDAVQDEVENSGCKEDTESDIYESDKQDADS